MNFRVPIAGALAGLVIALVPLAYGYPAGETWVAGLYDDADFDQIAIFITWTVGAVEPLGKVEIAPDDAAVAAVPPPEAAAPPPPALPSYPIRAPPAV